MQTNTKIEVKEDNNQTKFQEAEDRFKQQNSTNGQKKIQARIMLPLSQREKAIQKQQESKPQKKELNKKQSKAQQSQQIQKAPQYPLPNQAISIPISTENIHEVQVQGDQVGEDNQDNWTDATESIAADDEDDIWVVDDDIIEAMELDSQEQGQEDEHENKGQEQEDQNDDQEGQSTQVKDQVNLQELQNQFVKGGQSDQDWRLGLHEKFCTSVGVLPDCKMVVTGGGDDKMLCFRESNGKWQQFYRLNHGETVSKVQVSFDGKYVVSLSQKEIFCTDITKLQSKKLEVEEPVDVVCHKQGGVLAAAYGFTVAIHNLKGLDLFANFHLDLPPSSISFSDNGKQIIAACENKLRFITPKTGQIVKVAGNEFHKQEISTLAIQNTLVATGCIEGKVYLSSLAKGNILGGLDVFKGSINCLSFVENYLLVAPQGDGVHWTDPNKLKILFHSPAEISVSAIVNVHSPNHFVIGDLDGGIHFLDRRAPKTIISKRMAGNSIHALESKGSLVFAACEDGYVRVFDIAKMQ